jgi:hypothetical protein
MRLFSGWSDTLVERHEFQFCELVSFNAEYECVRLMELAVEPRRWSPTPTREEPSPPQQ